MIIKKSVTKEVTQDQVVDVLCNKCGKTCNNEKRYYKGKSGDGDFYGLVETEVHGGYMSKFIGDMTSIKFSVCEECVSEFVKTFKLPPEVKGEFSHDYVSQKEYDKKTKEYEKSNHKEWVEAIKKLCLELGEKPPKGLNKMSNREHYDLRESLMKKKAKSKESKTI